MSGEIDYAALFRQVDMRLLALEHERALTLGWRRPDGTMDVTWTFVLAEVAPGVTRLLEFWIAQGGGGIS